MELFNYKKLIEKHSIQSVKELRQLFWDEICWHWVDLYKQQFPKHGEITLQNFFSFCFVIDHVWEDQEDVDLPETRVLAVFGISGADDINTGNRKTMRSYWGSMTQAYSHFGCKFDKGHFIAHGFGGPIDVNLFPQRRDVNRGWCPEGKRYRSMERFIAAHPGTLVFSRPLYCDLTCCPGQLEYGYCDEAMNLEVEIFPNR